MKFMYQAKKGQGGFSLVELMVVVTIIGILASLAIPRFQRFSAKAKQSEARTNLANIHTLQTAYHGEQNTYGSFAEIGFNEADLENPAIGNSIYNYTMNSATQNTFQAQAQAAAGRLASCSTVDTWLIDHDKVFTPGTGLNGC